MSLLIDIFKCTHKRTADGGQMGAECNFGERLNIPFQQNIAKIIVKMKLLPVYSSDANIIG